MSNQDSRTKKSTYNMLMGFANQFITLVLSFVSRSVFIYTLGTEYLGLNGIFADVLNLLSMADLGFNTAMAYSFYKPLSEKDEEKLAALVGFYSRVYTVIAVLVTVIGVALIPFLPYVVKTEKEIPNLVLYYLFSLAGIVISYLFVYRTTILTADQKNYKVTRITIWTNVAKTLLQIVVLLAFKNYILYLIINIVMQLVNNIIASRCATKEYPYILKGGSIDKQMQKDIFDNMKSVFVYKVGGTLFNATDNLIISAVIGTAVVGLYSNYLMISNKLLLIIQIIFSALTASIGNLVVNERAEKRYEIFQAVQSVSFILCGIITSTFCVVVDDLVIVWLGEAFTISYLAVIALTINTYLSCVLQPLWSYRDATGMYRKTKYIMLIGAIINIVLSIVLGYRIGLAGVILASAIARLASYFWYEPQILFKEYFETKVSGYFLSLLKNFLLVVMIVAIMRFCTKGIAIHSWLGIFVEGAVVGSICAIFFLVAYHRSPGFQIIVGKVKAIVKKVGK